MASGSYVRLMIIKITVISSTLLLFFFIEIVKERKTINQYVHIAYSWEVGL